MSSNDKHKLSAEEREQRRRSAEVGSERRRLIEHTRREDLTAEEIEARKRAHAERKADKKKSAARDKKKKEEPSVKSGLMKDSKAAGKQNEAADKKRKKYRPVEPPKKKDAPPPPPPPAEEEALDMDDFRKARNKLKNRKRLKRLIIVLILTIIAAAVYYTRSLWMPKLQGILDKKHDTIVNDGEFQTGNFPLDIGTDTSTAVSRLDGSLVVLDSGHVLTYDTNGKLRDTSYHNYGNPVIKSEDKRMLLYDLGGVAFKLFGKTGEVYEKRMEETVMMGSISANGDILIVTEDDRYATNATVFDKNGSVIYNWSNGDKIIDSSFTYDGAGCVFATFAVSEGRMYSKVSIADMSRSDSVLISEPLEGLVMQARQNKEGNIWAITDEKLYLLSDIGQVIGSYSFTTEPAAFGLCGESACIALSGIGHESEKLLVFGAEDLTLTPKTPENDLGGIVKIICYDGMVFVLGEAKLNAYAPDGSLLSTANVDGGQYDLVYADDAVYMLGRREINKIKFKT